MILLRQVLSSSHNNQNIFSRKKTKNFPNESERKAKFDPLIATFPGFCFLNVAHLTLLGLHHGVLPKHDQDQVGNAGQTVLVILVECLPIKKKQITITLCGRELRRLLLRQSKKKNIYNNKKNTQQLAIIMKGHKSLKLSLFLMMSLGFLCNIPNIQFPSQNILIQLNGNTNWKLAITSTRLLAATGGPLTVPSNKEMTTQRSLHSPRNTLRTPSATSSYMCRL